MWTWTIGVLAATAVAIAAMAPGVLAPRTAPQAAAPQWTLVISPEGVSLRLDRGRVIVTLGI